MRISRYTALLLFISPLFGASLSFDAAITEFVEHNYDLQIARHEAQKSYANLITAKERPNPTLNGAYEFMNLNNRFSDVSTGSNAQVTLMLAHPIETAGKRDRRIEVATRSISFSHLIYDETVREQIMNLIHAYYAVAKDQIDLANAMDNAKAYTNITTIAKAKLDHGFLSQIDYQKIALQQIDYGREIENSRLSLAQDKETLASLLARPSSDLSVSDPLDTADTVPPLEELMDKVAERPDCKAAKENLAIADASLRLEKSNAVPNVTIGAEYASFGPTYNPPLAGVNFSVPLPLYDRNEGDIERSRINTLQATNLYDKTLRAAKADLLQSYEALLSRQRIYESMKTGFTTSKELKEKQEKIFALKGISVLELMDAQKSYRDYQKNLTHAQIDLRIAVELLKLNSGLSSIDPKGH